MILVYWLQCGHSRPTGCLLYALLPLVKSVTKLITSARQFRVPWLKRAVFVWLLQILESDKLRSGRNQNGNPPVQHMRHRRDLETALKNWEWLPNSNSKWLGGYSPVVQQGQEKWRQRGIHWSGYTGRLGWLGDDLWVGYFVSRGGVAGKGKGMYAF